MFGYLLNRAAFGLRIDNDVAQFAAIRAGFRIDICQVPLAAANPDLVRVLADEFSVDLETWPFASYLRCDSRTHAAPGHAAAPHPDGFARGSPPHREGSLGGNIKEWSFPAARPAPEQMAAFRLDTIEPAPDRKQPA